MTTKPLIILTFILSFALTACNKATPAGFWKSYKSELLLNNLSDQGPNGGYRAMFWKSGQANTFNTANVLDFASRNSWTLVDSAAYNSEQTSRWVHYKEAVFPLTSKGFSETPLNDAVMLHFPRWFGGPVKVYRFKTGWITIQPGTDSSFEENGFVVFNSNGTEMAVYHLWGD